jgi:hypothetical protein
LEPPRREEREDHFKIYLYLVFASLRLCVFNAVAVSSNIEEATDSGIVALI